jgi:hypothetical protein
MHGRSAALAARPPANACAYTSTTPPHPTPPHPTPPHPTPPQDLNVFIAYPNKAGYAEMPSSDVANDGVVVRWHTLPNMGPPDYV